MAPASPGLRGVWVWVLRVLRSFKGFGFRVLGSLGFEVLGLCGFGFRVLRMVLQFRGRVLGLGDPSRV